MRRRDFYWSLFHTPEKNQLDNLRTDQVEAVFAAIPNRNRNEWFIWRDGFDAWKPFDDFPQLLLSLRKASDQQIEAPPPPPEVSGPSSSSTAPSKSTSVLTSNSPPASTTPRKPKSETPKSVISEEGDLEMGGDADLELTLMKTNAAEDRINFRFDKTFDVKIISGDKTYTNTTVNISLKGMQLKNPLPKGLPRYFNVEIYQKNRMIPVVCSEVSSSQKDASHRVKIEVNDYVPGLLALLLGN